MSVARYALPLLLLLAACLATYRLGAASLLGDEGIYAEVALSAVRFGELFPMRLGGSPITGDERTPPLFALKQSIVLPLEVLAVKLFGNVPWAYRLPSALSLLVLIGSVWRIASPYGRFPAALASLLLLGAPRLLTSHGFREAVLDGPLTACFALCLALWWRPPVYFLTRPIRFQLALAVCLALSLAIKFPVGLALPAIGWLGARVGLAQPTLPPSSLMRLGLVAAVSVVGWAAWSVLAVAGDLETWSAAQHQEIVARATSRESGEATEGLHGYLGVLADDFGWWLAPLCLGPLLWRRPLGPLAAGGAIWSVLVLVPFFLAHGKLHWYLYPAWPGIALAIAAVLAELARRLQGRWQPAAKPAILALAILGLLDSLAAVRNHDRVLAVDHLVAELQSTGAMLYLPPTTWQRGIDLWNLHALRRAPRVDWLGRAPADGPCFWTLANDEQAMLAYLGAGAARRRLDLEPSNRGLIALEICGKILPHRERQDPATLAPDSHQPRNL